MYYSAVISAIESSHISRAVAEIDNGEVSPADRINYLKNAHMTFVTESAMHFLHSDITLDDKKFVMGVIISCIGRFDASLNNGELSFTTGEDPEEMMLHVLDLSLWAMRTQSWESDLI